MVAVQVIMATGVSMSYPLVPLFLEKELGLSRGRDVELWSGFIAAALFLPMAIFAPLWGNLADRRGRKLMVQRSTLAVAGFSLLTFFVTSPLQLLVLRLIMGMFSGYAASATALVGSVAPKEKLGYALGMIGTAQVIGMVFGPMLGGLVGTYFSYRFAFLSTSVLALIAFTLTSTAVQENFVPPPRGPGARPALLNTVLGLARSKDLLPVFVVLMLNRAATGGAAPVLALFVGELDIPDSLVPMIAGLAFSVAGLGAAIGAPLSGRLADRVGSRPVLLLALAGSAVLYVPQAFVTSGLQFLVLRFMIGLLDGSVSPAAYALIGRSAPPGQQSAAYGLTASATAMGSFGGPLVSGAMAAGFGLRSVFFWTAALSAIGSACVGAKVRQPVAPGTDGRGPANQIGQSRGGGSR